MAGTDSDAVGTLAKTAKQAAATAQSVLTSLWSPLSLSSMSAPLCDECIKLDWNYILKGTLTSAAYKAFEIRLIYKLDGPGLGAAFLSCDIPSVTRRATDTCPCPFCLLWLRAYRRVFGEVEPMSKERDRRDFFTYYVIASDFGSQWRGSLRGIDADMQVQATRQKAMKSFRLRYRGRLGLRDFETDLELTCLDSDLPRVSRSRGGRIIPDDCCTSKIFKKWLTLCRDGHGSACEGNAADEALQRAKSMVKVRFIDVYRLKVVDGSLEDQYCALSYVLGAVETFKAKRIYLQRDEDNPGQLCIDLKPFLPSATCSEADTMASIPRTIADAIEVTRRMGLKYLWVDALCIIQDTDELAASIPFMDIVYMKAVVTIVAAAGMDANAGLPRAHPGAPKITQVTECVNGRTFMLAQPSLNIVIQRSVWSSRAWTFQEGKLSSRQLVFSDNGIYFRCQQDTWAEDSIEQIDLKRPLWGTREEVQPVYVSKNTPRDIRDANFAEYTYDVRAYTARTLRHQEDILRAFSGIVSNFQSDKLQCRFLWGLPCCHFDSALLWKHVDIWSYNLWKAPEKPTDHDSSSKRWSSSDDSDDSDDSRQKQKDQPGASGNEILSPVTEKASETSSGEDEASGPYLLEKIWSEMSQTRLLERRASFPSWSWCGWLGPIGYFPRRANEPDLHLVKTIESCIAWPWDRRSSPNDYDWRGIIEDGVLTFEASHAFVDFEKLPGGVVRDEDYPWPGWPMDSEDFLLYGKHECILLSRQLKEPVDFNEAWLTAWRRLDPEIEDCLVNIMVLGQSEGRLGQRTYRRGIGMMLESVWNTFSPERRMIHLG